MKWVAWMMRKRGAGGHGRGGVAMYLSYSQPRVGQVIRYTEVEEGNGAGFVLNNREKQHRLQPQQRAGVGESSRPRPHTRKRM